MDERGPSISEAELEVLKVLWERPAVTVREVAAVLEQQGKQKRAYTTVQTLLQRLEAKGYVASQKDAAVNRYQAALSREALVSQRLRELAADLCDGASSPLLLALVEGTHLSAADVRQLRQWLDRLPGPKGRPRSG